MRARYAAAHPVFYPKTRPQQTSLLESEKNAHWVGRICGAVIVAGVAFLILTFWSFTRDLSVAIRAVCAGAAGGLTLYLGGSLSDWVLEMRDDQTGGYPCANSGPPACRS